MLTQLSRRDRFFEFFLKFNLTPHEKMTTAIAVWYVFCCLSTCSLMLK